MKYYLVTAHRAFKDGRKLMRPKTLTFVCGAIDDLARSIDEDLIEGRYYSFPHPDALPFKGENKDVSIRAAIAQIKDWRVPEVEITAIQPCTIKQCIVAQAGEGIRMNGYEIL